MPDTIALLQVAAPQLTTDYGWTLLRMAVALIAVCLIAYVALRFGLKRIAGARASKGLIREIDRHQLAPGRAVCVLQVGERAILVGMTEHQISMLGELDADIVADLPEQPPSRFAEVLAMVRRNGSTPGTGTDDE